MARVDSIFNMRGSLGDYVFYTLNGKQVARRKPKKKKGRKADAQENVKVLNNEFAKVSSAAKLFRQALDAECEALRNPGIHSGLMKTLLAVKNTDVAEKGYRTVAGGLETEKGREAFRNFKFQKQRKSAPMLISATRKVSDVELRVSGVLPKSFKIIEMQLDFEGGKFRRAEHPFEDFGGGNAIFLKRSLRSKKGYTEFWMLGGDGFLGGVVVESTIPK